MDKGISIVLLVVGMILIYLGYNESQSVGSKLNEAFTGSPTDRSLIFLIGGAAAAAFGGFNLFRSLK